MNGRQTFLLCNKYFYVFSSINRVYTTLYIYLTVLLIWMISGWYRSSFDNSLCFCLRTGDNRFFGIHDLIRMAKLVIWHHLLSVHDFVLHSIFLYKLYLFALINLQHESFLSVYIVLLTMSTMRFIKLYPLITVNGIYLK